LNVERERGKGKMTFQESKGEKKFLEGFLMKQRAGKRQRRIY
jgi:hypothetical protein